MRHSKNMNLLRKFDSPAHMYQALADAIEAKLLIATETHPPATLVVPGGTTPGEVFDVLRQRPIKWDRVIVTLTDERWVPTDSYQSNEKLVRTRLIKDLASSAQFVGLKSAVASAADGETTANAAIAALPRPFDVMLLGMGNDGHTASLIPGSTQLSATLDVTQPELVRAIDPSEAASMGSRITLTRRALLDARVIF